MTTKCDYKCDYCFFSEKNILNKQTLSDEAIKIIMRNIVEYKVPLVSINGGDPFMFRNLPELIKCIMDNQTYCIVGGNATYLDKEYCKQLKEAGLRFLQIGLDSLSPNKKNTLRKSFI